MTELVIEILMRPIFGILEAVAGLLWPSDDATVRRLQRCCLATLLAGLLALPTAFALASWFSSGWWALGVVVLGGVLLVVSGQLGNAIERRCQRTRRQEPSDRPEAYSPESVTPPQ